MTIIAIISIALLSIIAISWLSVAKLIDVLNKANIVDTPNERTLHKGAVPRGGGLVIIGLLMLSIITAAVVSSEYILYLPMLVYVLAWAALSWWDDRYELSAKKRFIYQILFSIAALFIFGFVSQVQLNDSVIIPLGIFGAVLTVLGMVWLANLYNFMDGMDGLVASQTIIAAITLTFWFCQAGNIELACICMVLAAATYGFLLWNWQPAKIFMGDVGSISLGAFFALLTVIGVTQYNIPVLSFIILFAVLVFDATSTLMKRLFNKEKIWQAHRRHHYQRLANVGVKHNKIVISMIFLMLICSIIASISIQYRVIVIPCLGTVFIMLAIASLFVRSFEKKIINRKV